jgi:hypothetical protein
MFERRLLGGLEGKMADRDGGKDLSLAKSRVNTRKGRLKAHDPRIAI